MTGTTAGFLQALETPPIFGTPYGLGGTTPGFRLDCSGMIVCGAETQGVTDIPRTTQEQWLAAEARTNSLRVVANTPTDPVMPGDLVYFYVPGDGGAAPQHVGVYTRPGWMVDAPHSGLTVMYQPIPNVPGIIWVLGYARITAFSEPLPPEQESSMVSQTVSFQPGQIDVFQVKDGALFHYWKAGTPNWGSESVNQRTNCKASFPQQVPQVSVLDRQVMVTVEDAAGHAWYFAQTVGQKTWGVNEL